MSAQSRLLASVLYQAWRSEPPEPGLTTEELAGVCPMLVGSGAGPLGWWRVRATALASSVPGSQLRDAFRATVLGNGVHEHRLAEVLRVVRDAGLDPLLVKGWDVARFYPEPAVRPHGDIDLVFHPEHMRKAAEVLTDAGLLGLVDMEHASLGSPKASWMPNIWDRSRAVNSGIIEARVLSPEDRLRHLCFHALTHGIWRPLWLVDVAVVLEALPPDFDWDLCLGTDSVRRNWVQTAIGLAGEVLGAEVPGGLPREAQTTLPQWVIPTLLRQWERPTKLDHPDVEESILVGFRRLHRLPEMLRRRWWDGMRVTIWADAPFDSRSRVPLQLRNVAWQTRGFLRRNVPDEQPAPLEMLADSSRTSHGTSLWR